MSSKAMSLKARIRNLAKAKDITAQVILQNYMFECFLARLSISDYSDRFVLKGGMLISAIVGLDTRTTMDLDATLRRLQLTEENVRNALHSICAVHLSDDVQFEIGKIEAIRPDDQYGGYRAAIIARYDTLETPLSIDISTGDVITPSPIRYTFRGMFDEKKEIELWAYNIETVMAEKAETILRRGVFNTRARDFYDVYILSTTQEFDPDLVREAIIATSEHRHSATQIADMHGILQALRESTDLQSMWQKYCRQYSYARGITYEQVVESLETLLLK